MADIDAPEGSDYDPQPLLDSSLARGLFNQLWRDAGEMHASLREAFLNLAPQQYSSRKTATRIIEQLDKLLSNRPNVLARGLRAEHRAPYIWACFLIRDEAAAVKDWEERALTFNVFGLGLGLGAFQGSVIEHPVRVRVGEHAVRRVIQRIRRHGNPVPDRLAILEELRQAAMHGWLHHLLLLADSEALKSVGLTVRPETFMVPTQTGLFLGVPSLDREYLDLRTYVHKSMFSTQQWCFWMSGQSAHRRELAYYAMDGWVMTSMGSQGEDNHLALDHSLECIGRMYTEFDAYEPPPPEEQDQPSVLLEFLPELIAEIQAEEAQAKAQAARQPRKAPVVVKKGLKRFK